MNLYKVTFFFNDEWQFITFTSNMLANAALEHSDDILDFICENDGQYMETIIHTKEGERCVTFSNNPRFLNVYYPEDEEKYGDNAGTIIEKNIPWLLLQVTNSNGPIQEYYNLIDYI